MGLNSFFTKRIFYSTGKLSTLNSKHVFSKLNYITKSITFNIAILLPINNINSFIY